jgi:cbb3-type cytochrome oxidase subunit 3
VVEISSTFTLPSVEASWALAPKNRNALQNTLRNTLELSDEDELTITSITAVGPTGSSSSARRLSTKSGVKIDFKVQIAQSAALRVTRSTQILQKLSQGDVSVASSFVQQLDSQLVELGEPALNLQTSDLVFEQPVTKTVSILAADQTASSSQGSGTLPLVRGGSSNGGSQGVEKTGSSVGVFLLAMVCVGLFAVLYARSGRKQASSNDAAEDMSGFDDLKTQYTTKVMDMGFSQKEEVDVEAVRD